LTWVCFRCMLSGTHVDNMRGKLTAVYSFQWWGMFCVEIIVYIWVIWKKYLDTGWCKCEKKTGVEEICVKGFGFSFAKQHHFSFTTSEKFVKCNITTVWYSFIGVGGGGRIVMIICMVQPDYQVLVHETWCSFSRRQRHKVLFPHITSRYTWEWRNSSTYVYLSH